MSLTDIERNYKNNVFIDYISTKERLIEVYNAVKGTNYPADTDIQINTLMNVLYRFIQNDISFVLDGKLVVLIEHQSTINENMPIRMLEYISIVYDHMIDNEAYYKKSRIMLPRPEFIVFYNGKEPYDERRVLKLSESFYDKGGESLELNVMVYNINRGKNVDILERSRALYEYATLTSKVREYVDLGNSLEEAIGSAVKYCLEHDIMVPYLKEHGSSIMGILIHEYSFEDELRVAKKEAAERGMLEGIAKGRVERDTELAQRMAALGKTEAEIAEILGDPKVN
jgi:hypothetical protein